jgi:hypothetical protein
MVPIYQELLDNNANNKLKIVVYSGDDDAVCSTEGTQRWIWDMGYNIRGERWNQYKVNNQTAGYITRWENNFSFVTIRGAGHEVRTRKSLLLSLLLIIIIIRFLHTNQKSRYTYGTPILTES